jgi:hypothetical protein
MSFLSNIINLPKSFREFVYSPTMPPLDSQPSYEGPVAETAERISGDNKITPYGTYVGDYRMYDKMGKCPTLAFVRSTVTAPMSQLGYVVEADDGVPENIATELDPLVRPVFSDLVQKCGLALEYGWIGMEKV